LTLLWSNVAYAYLNDESIVNNENEIFTSKVNSAEIDEENLKSDDELGIGSNKPIKPQQQQQQQQQHQHHRAHHMRNEYVATYREHIDDPCYDRASGVAQRCIPHFENIAYSKSVWASSTCGSPPITYCIHQSLGQTGKGGGGTGAGANGAQKICDRCDAASKASIKEAKYLTDLEETNATCWISAPVYEPTQPSNITLHIAFGKKYELTYISLQFCTLIKPDSLAIMKSMDYGKTWIPFQFYSSDCKKVYNRPLRAKITQANEQEAICTDQHLQSSPFNTNRIGFSTLEGRPSFHEFDTSPVLQDWVTATDIKIIFNRLLSPVFLSNGNGNQQAGASSIVLLNSSNTLSHMSRQSRSQLQTQVQNYGYYFAAVSELAVGGRCKCNGHASRCILNRLVSTNSCFWIIEINSFSN
jgi:netrin 1